MSIGHAITSIGNVTPGSEFKRSANSPKANLITVYGGQVQVMQITWSRRTNYTAGDQVHEFYAGDLGKFANKIAICRNPGVIRHAYRIRLQIWLRTGPTIALRMPVVQFLFVLRRLRRPLIVGGTVAAGGGYIVGRVAGTKHSRHGQLQKHRNGEVLDDGRH